MTDRDFQRPDGSTRILYYYDQTTKREWTREEINEALSSLEGQNTLPRDVSGHGTIVGKIAAGNGNGSGRQFRGVAYESELIVVKLGTSLNDSFPRTTQLMSGLTYVIKKAQERNMPIAINLSFGNTYGSHDGTSILERFMDNAVEIGRCVICVGSGNEGTSAGHTGGFLQEGERVTEEFSIGEYERNLSIQIWKNYVDRFRIFLTAPSGRSVEIETGQFGKQVINFPGLQVFLYIGMPAPYSVNQEIYMEFLPVENDRYLGTGVWQIRLEGEKVVYGRYDMYMPSGVSRSVNTLFLTPTPEATFTIPSTAGKVITVGAYQVGNDAYASFSGRGFLLNAGEKNRLVIQSVKPDIVAPGENILVSRKLVSDITAPFQNFVNEYRLDVVSGTSFAVPFVTGSAAILMEWGIIRENDPYLYGEKVKAYLQNGARKLAGTENRPDSLTGWGALCLFDSIPRE